MRRSVAVDHCFVYRPNRSRTLASGSTNTARRLLAHLTTCLPFYAKKKSRPPLSDSLDSWSFGPWNRSWERVGMVRTMIGGLLAANYLRLPYFAAAVLALLNWLNGYFILPESLPKDRRTAIDFKKVNPFSAIIALTQVCGIGNLVLVYIFSVFGQFFLQTTWVL